MRKRDVAMYAPYCFCDENSDGAKRLCVAIPVHKKNIDLDDIVMSAPELIGNTIVIDFDVPDHRSEEVGGVYFFAEDIILRSSDFELSTLVDMIVVLRVHLSGDIQTNSVSFSAENNMIQPKNPESRGAGKSEIIQRQSPESR